MRGGATMSGVMRGSRAVSAERFACQSFSASTSDAEVGAVEEDALAGLALPDGHPAV